MFTQQFQHNFGMQHLFILIAAVVNNVIQGDQHKPKAVLVYPDGTSIYSSNRDEHVFNPTAGLNMLHRRKVHVRLLKCTIVKAKASETAYSVDAVSLHFVPFTWDATANHYRQRTRSHSISIEQSQFDQS